MGVSGGRDHLGLRGFIACALLLCCAATAGAQQLEPRRWSHLPVDVNFAGAAYAYTEADIAFDPVLELENVKLDMHTFVASYIRTFEAMDHSARVDLVAPYQHAHWEGLLKGEPAETTRQGFADPIVRLSVNLLGAPPLKGAEFAKYQASHPNNTIVGAAVGVHLPLGQYYSDKLLNLGQNRFTIRPTLGVVHNHGKWAGEATGSLWFYTDNNDFWGGNKLEQDPLYSLQGHLVYTLRPGVWASGSGGYGYGGESTLNDVPKDDARANWVAALSAGYSFTRNVGVKLSYIRLEAGEDTGYDSDTILTALSVLW